MPGAIKVSEAVSIAIHALVLLAANPAGRLSAKEIADTFKISSAHLAKVLQRLGKAGLVKSTRGPNGGFALAKPADDITLLEIYELFEGSLEQADCLLDRSVCNGSRCILGGAIRELNQQIRQTFAKHTLAELTRTFILGSNPPLDSKPTSRLA